MQALPTVLYLNLNLPCAVAAAYQLSIISRPTSLYAHNRHTCTSADKMPYGNVS